MNFMICVDRCAGKDVKTFRARHGILKEFNCREVTSTWSCCGRETEMAFTHRQFGKGGKERTEQLDFIVGPSRTSDKA